jgi:superfamily II DNA helicase RecQ
LAESEGIPVYAICTNDQLAEMAKQRIKSVEDLRRIPGIGEAKAEKYGEHFVRMLQQESPPPEANP